MSDVALWDLVSPYFLLGNAAGNYHAALAALAVDEYEEADDASASVLRGRARIYADMEVWFDPRNFSFGVRAGNAEGHPQDDPSRRDPWIDLRDTTVDFQMLAPHVGSAIVAAGHGPIGNPPPAAFAPTDAVLDALDAPPIDAPFSDYPSTEFTLDLVITSAVLRPPFLKPARMRADGALEPDPDRQNVALTLPKIKLRITQGSLVGAQPIINLQSFGASGLDDPGDIGVAQMVSMDPPYAFIGPGRVVGFGFRSAVLDLSTGSTPPDILEQFGYDQSWTGVYFPEIRLFVAPQGAEGWAVNAGVRNLLIGIGRTPGVTGDFELDVINQGGELHLGARFYSLFGEAIGVRRIDDTHLSVVLPDESTMIVDVEGRRPPYVIEISLDNGTNWETEKIKSIDTWGEDTKTILARVTASGDPPVVLTIDAQRGDSGGGSGTRVIPGKVPQATVTASSTTRAGQPVANPKLIIKNQTDSEVTVALEDGSTAEWTVGGVVQAGGPAATAKFPLAPNATQNVQATVAGTTTKTPIYFHYDEPDQMSDAKLDAYALNADLTHTAESLDDTIENGWTGGLPVAASSEYANALHSLPAGTEITIVGHASWEGDDAKAEYNGLLSDRRAKVARRLYDTLAGPGRLDIKRVVPPRGFADAKPAQIGDPENNPRRRWWRAELQNPISVAGLVTTGTVHRPPVPSTTVTTDTTPDPPPPVPKRPDFLRSIGAKVRIIRDDFIACELHGQIDIDTAAERTLREQPVPANEKPEFKGLGHQNPGDGIVSFRGVFTRNPGSDEWALDVLFGADPSDVDGLAATGTFPGQPLQDRSVGRNLLGMYALFFPLLAATSAEKPGTAEVEDLVLEGAMLAVPAALAATGWFIVERVVWYGGEVLVRQHEGEWSTSILADVETAVSADIKIGPLRLLTIAREKPLVARYKAIGVRFGADATGEAIFHPVFDSSKGYTLDVSKPGSLSVADPLGQVLKVDGAKISKSNPTFFEVQLASAVDLGVVALERCGVRVTFADPPTIELTALGVGVDIPGVLAGHGYMSFDETGFAGRVDLTLVPLRLRLAASLAVRNIPEADGGPATAVAVAIEVEFPVAIPLWASGLGIYGLIGLFAMHFARNEEPDAASTTKALAWLKRAGGDPTHVENPQLWKPEIDHWAFGVGARVGTMGSSIVFNMKGVVLVELPGPRLLLMMKANLLMPMPKLKATAEGTMLAVLDIDAGRETLTIGIVIDFTIKPILELRIPIEAFFNGNQPEDWHVYLGQYPDQIRAKIFEVFSGSGYLMLAGDGLTAPGFKPSLPKPAGFAISTGLHVSMVWGSKSIGLYAELAAGFDAILGFSPLLVAGELYGRGELRLFIISISASATLNVRLGELPGQPDETGYEIHGEVCGSIDLFFFEIEGCVDFTLKDKAPPDIVIPTLVGGITVVGRSPALVHGTATDGPVDAGLGKAVEASAQPAEADMPVVPIDAIPVIEFSAPPMESGVTFRGNDLGGASGGHEVQRSSDKITYTLDKVELQGPLSPGTAPATWWTLRPPNEANEAAQLALLSWTPNPTPKALQASDELTESVKDRWGTVCDKAAPPTPVLWTFRYEPLGPSATGWEVIGEAWPDPPNTVRSLPTPTELDVSERWRSGDPMVDLFRGILPAEVVGAIVTCPQGDRPPRLTAPISAGRAALGTKLPDVLDEPGLSLSEVRSRLELGLPMSRAALSRVVAEPAGAVAPAPGCESRVLAAPRFDTLAPPKGDPLREQDIAKRWALHGFKPGDLADAVVLKPDVFDRGRLLLFVHQRALENRIVVRALAPTGAVVSEVKVNSSMLASWVNLPSTWVDPAGPWDDDITLVMNHLLVLTPPGQYVAVLVNVAGHLQADRIMIGLPADAKLEQSLPGPTYYVAALEALLGAEITRHDHDEHTASKNHKVLEAALGEASGTIPLMSPDTTYRVDVTWSADASNDEGGTANVSQQLQSFWFHTADDAPLRLDPWVLACVPYDGERYVFGTEPLKIAFATHDVTDLFAAHDYQLEVRLLAASARHPDPDVLLFPYPIVLDPADTVVQVPGEIFSPWETTVADVVDPNCVDIDENRTKHSVTTIPIPLEPATDYLLDIWRVPEDGTGGTEERVFRRAFGTSGFGSLDALAEFCRGSRVTHRAVPDGLAAKVKTAFAATQPEGEQLDNVLRGNVSPPHAGIEPMPVPDRPRIVVWWEGAGPTPQPTAVVVDANEPLWRERERAKLVTLAGTDVKHYELSRDPWISPEEGAGSDGVVDRIVRAPGGQRAVVILKPGSRGKKLSLVLRRLAFTESYLDGPGASDEDFKLVDVAFLKALWEED
jgi:large repetitive protein